MPLYRDIDKKHNKLEGMIEHQTKEVSIKKDNCINKLELSSLFWNMSVMYFDVCLDGAFFAILKKSKCICHLIATLENIINKIR